MSLSLSVCPFISPSVCHAFLTKPLKQCLRFKNAASTLRAGFEHALLGLGFSMAFGAPSVAGSSVPPVFAWPDVKEIEIKEDFIPTWNIDFFSFEYFD